MPRESIGNGSTPEHKPIMIGPSTDDTEVVGIVVRANVGTRRAPNEPAMTGDAQARGGRSPTG